MTRSELRAAAYAVVLVLVGSALAGCDTRAQFAPDLPTGAGLRYDDGVLVLDLGTPCRGVTEIDVTFDPATSASTRLVLTAPAPGADLQQADLVGPGAPSGPLEVETALPPGYDPTAAEQVSVLPRGQDALWSSTVDLDEVVEGSPDHPADTFYFGEEAGWLDPAGVQAENGESFLTLCTPEPGEG